MLHLSCTARTPGAALLALCALLALPGCQPSNSAEAPAPAPPAPVLQSGRLRFAAGHPQLALLATQPARPAREVQAELPARLVWNEERTQRVYAAFAGRVGAIRADLGQSVRAGAVLAQLASPDFGQAQADTARAQADQRLAQQSLARQRELFEAGIVARKDLEQAEADAARARAESARAGARTRLYGSGGGVDQQLALTATLAGVVVERNLNPGQELRPEQGGPGTPALFVITDPRSLWVQVDAREGDLASLQPGSRFVLRVPAYPGEAFEGRVTATADAIDPGSRTIKVRGVVDNPDRRLKAEMLATAQVRESRSTGVVVPAQAVVLRGTSHWVYVQREPGVFEPRRVTLGHEGPGEVIVATGLAEGEQVVTANVLLLDQQREALAQDGSSARSAGAADAGAPTQPAGARP